MAEELKPDLVLVPNQDFIINELVDMAEVYGVQIIDISKYWGVDLISFRGQRENKYESDIAFYIDINSCRHGAEEQLKFSELLFKAGKRIKIWGPSKLDSPLYLGSLNTVEIGNMVATVPILISDDLWANSFLYNNLGFLPYNEINFEYEQKEGVKDFINSFIRITKSKESRKNHIKAVKEDLKKSTSFDVLIKIVKDFKLDLELLPLIQTTKEKFLEYYNNGSN